MSALSGTGTSGRTGSGGAVPDNRGPVDPAAAGPRPAIATLAAVTLSAMGIALIALTLVDVASLLATYLAEDFVDGMTALVVTVMAAVGAAMMLVVIVVGVAMIVAAVRIWRRIRWAWIEGCAAAVVGALFAGVAFVSVDAGDQSLRAQLERVVAAVSVVAAFVVVGALVVARPWFGRLYLPRSDREAPFWMRRDRWP